MNEQIRELYITAMRQDSGEKWDTQEEFIERFAKLIVQECVAIVDDAERGGSNEIWDNAVKFIKRDLLEHFGVE